MLELSASRKLVLSLLAASLSSFMTGGCDQEGPRVYTAMPVDSAAHCLEPYVSLGLVDAEDLRSTCDPVCLTVDGALYVSPVCPPYPAEATRVSPDDSDDCKAALQLLDTDAGGACPDN